MEFLPRSLSIRMCLETKEMKKRDFELASVVQLSALSPHGEVGVSSACIHLASPPKKKTCTESLMETVGLHRWVGSLMEFPPRGLKQYNEDNEKDSLALASCFTRHREDKPGLRTV